MKKKFVAMIVVSSVGLVLGGLIYLGISSSPEILESKKSIKVEEANEASVINNETIVVEEETMFEQPVIVEESYGGVAADYVPSIFDDSEVVYVDSPVNSISLIFSSDSFNDYGEDRKSVV